MLDRPRRLILTWSATCFVLVGVLALLAIRGRSPLTRLDDLGRAAEDRADERDLLVTVLEWVELATATFGMTALTVLAASLLLLRRHTRAALFVVAVMSATALATTLLKVTLSRGRPEWQPSVDLLTTQSFPSGHASSMAAFAGVLTVLTRVFVRRSSMRRTATTVLVAAWLVVCVDRVLLGRHYPSDVLAGTMLGIGFVLLGLALLDPEPRGHAAKADPLPEVYPTERRLAVVLNPVKFEDVGQFRAIVAAMAAESGWSVPTWHYTTVEDPGTGMAEAASVAGADLVLVCGGDGTVREVCAELAGTGIPVGIVPAGTGNLLARNLDIPLYIRSAIDVALNGQDRAIDLVRVTGDGIEDDTHFLVMAGMGFDAAVMEGVNDSIKDRVGWFAYVLAGLRAMMFPPVRVDVAIDGGEFTRHRARTVVVGNVGFLQAGMPLLPDAAIDDGLLDVVILHPKWFLSWLPLAYRVLARRPRTDDTINRMTGRTVVVRAQSDTPRQLDGDTIGRGRELNMECLHGRLLVRVPR